MGSSSWWTILVLILAFLIQLKGGWVIGILGLLCGTVIGYVLAVPDPYADPQVKRNELKQFADFMWRREIVEPSELELMYKNFPETCSSELKGKIEEFMRLFHRDLIMYWFAPLKVTSSSEFEDAIKYSLYGAFSNSKQHFELCFSEDERMLELASIIFFGLANGIQLHSQEFRWISNMIDSEEHINVTKLDIHGSFYTDQTFSLSEQRMQMYRISDMILKRIMPKCEYSSNSMRSIVTELFATSVLEPLLNLAIDPIMLNNLIALVFSGLLSEVSEVDVENEQSIQSAQKEIEIPEKLIEILQGPLFDDFSEYLEHVYAPRYLRFWTNVDFFKRFSSGFETNDKTSLVTIKQDAKAIFDMHFGANAEYPIPFMTEMLLMTNYAHLKNVDESPKHAVKRLHSELVKDLAKSIGTKPSYDCFDESVKKVFEILLLEHVSRYNEDYQKYKKNLTSKRNSALSKSENSLEILTMQDARPDRDTNDSEDNTSDGNEVLNHLVSALSSLREQHMLISTNIENIKTNQAQQSSLALPFNIANNMETQAKLTQMIKTQQDLELQIDQLYGMVSEIEKENSADVERASAISTMAYLDLTGLEVHITDMSKEARPSTGIKSFVEFSFAGANQNRLRNTIFMIQVEKISGGSGWLLYKKYSDFQKLDVDLKQQFAKVSKIRFPSIKSQSITILNINQEAEADRINSLCKQLEGYLRMLLVDQLLCESKPMQEFFKPELDESVLQDSAQSDRSPKKIAPELRKKISEVLKSIRRPSFMPSSSSLKDETASISSIDMADISKPEDIVNDEPEQINDEVETIDKPIENPKEVRDDNNGESANRPKTTADFEGGATVDVDLLIDTSYSLLTEIFELHAPTQWVRRKALGALRQILLQQSKTGYMYSMLASNIRDQIRNGVDGVFCEQTTISLFDAVLDSLWPPPERDWFKQTIMTPEELKEQRKQSFEQAKQAIIKFMSGTWIQQKSNAQETTPEESRESAQQTIIFLHRLAGKQNVISGSLRMLQMLQYPQLNRILATNMLETIVRTIFSSISVK